MSVYVICESSEKKCWILNFKKIKIVNVTAAVTRTPKTFDKDLNYIGNNVKFQHIYIKCRAFEKYFSQNIV